MFELRAKVVERTDCKGEHGSVQLWVQSKSLGYFLLLGLFGK